MAARKALLKKQEAQRQSELDKQERERLFFVGNSSTLTRLESGEHAVGFVLLENILKAKARATPVQYRLPAEGAVLIPGLIEQCSRFVEVTGRAGDVWLIHPFMLHRVSPIAQKTCDRLAPLDQIHRWTHSSPCTSADSQS